MIFFMLLWVYRSVITVALVLVIVLCQVAAARGVVAVLAHNNIIGLSVYSTNLLTLLSIAAGTDYAIFLLGRYHGRAMPARLASRPFTPPTAELHVVLGSGLTIIGALYCSTFTRLPYFNSLGVPAAIGISVALLGSLDPGPGDLWTTGGHFGLFRSQARDEDSGLATHRHRYRALAGPILVGVGRRGAHRPTRPARIQTSYNVRSYLPASSPASVGYDAAERHFSAARLNPELLMLETDHDMRNPVDMLVAGEGCESRHTLGLRWSSRSPGLWARHWIILRFRSR